MRSELDTIDHVLRGSLNTILLNLQLLATSLERDEQSRALLDRASSELRRLATELLPATFRIVGLEINELRPVDLGELVGRATAEHGLKRAPAPRRGPTVVGDPALLASAIAHLVGNAVVATPPGAPAPVIALDTGPDGTVGVVVRNTCGGPSPPLTAEGIPAARGHLGGLVTTMRIARLHGGTLTYERREGELVARLSIPAGLASRGPALPGRDERGGHGGPAPGPPSS